MNTIEVTNINPIKSRLFELAKVQYLNAVMVLEPVVEKYIARGAVSFGKDSSLMLSALITAYSNVQKRVGKENMPGPLIISHGNTGIENPIMEKYAQRQLVALERYLVSLDIEHEIHVSVPPDRYSWAVMYLSGLKLPTIHLSKTRDCSVILKRDPAKVVERAITKKYGQVVTVLGSRNDESSSRKHSNEKHGIETGELAEIVRDDGSVALAIAPIVNLSTAEVWGVIRTFGERAAVVYGDFLPYWCDSSWKLERIYDSASDQCQMHDYGMGGMEKGGCSARTGCALCTVVPDDKSAKAMLREPMYAFMGNLLLIRNFIANNAMNMDYRRFMGRKPDDYGYVAIHPNCHNEKWLTRMLRWMLQADKVEEDRAAAFRALVAGGRLMDDEGYAYIFSDPTLDDYQREEWLAEYVADMSEPMFKLVNERQLILIEAFWSRDALTLKHYTAMKIWDEVYNQNILVPFPDDHEVNPKVDKIPESLYVYVGNDSYADGVYDGLTHALASGTCLTKRVVRDDVVNFGVGYHYAPEITEKLLSVPRDDLTFDDLSGLFTSDISLSFPSDRFSEVLKIEPTTECDDSGYMVDDDAAKEIVGGHIRRYVEKHDQDGMVSRRNSVFYHFISLGLIRLSPGTIRSCSRLLMRGALYESNGLHHIGKVASEEVAERAISKRDYQCKLREIKAQERKTELVTIDKHLSSSKAYLNDPMGNDIAILKTMLGEIKKRMREAIYRMVGTSSFLEQPDSNSFVVDGMSMVEMHDRYYEFYSSWQGKLNSVTGLLSLLKKGSYIRVLADQACLPMSLTKTLEATTFSLSKYFKECWIEALNSFIELCKTDDFYHKDFIVYFDIYDADKQIQQAKKKISAMTIGVH